MYKGVFMSAYYESDDLKKFGEMRRVNPELGAAFFDYYDSAMKEGALSAREKSLIALAVAHTLKCPYCIEAYTKSCMKKGADEEQMNEAVHVAAAMAAGVTLVHGVQMMNHIDEMTL
jgi:alkylhydroperoxidase/carboxymuconolactone decarboxylase family protein